MGIVREHINFERGIDPKKSIGLGIFSRKKFINNDEAIDYMVNHLTTILDKKAIPRDIIRTKDETWFNDKYYFDLADYIEKYLLNPSTDLDTLLAYLHDKLMDLGFQKY